MRRFLLPAILFFSAVLVGQGKVLVVDINGKAGPHKTIMSAVKLAKSGDQIWIHPGDYKESVVITGKSLTLLGLGKKVSDVGISGIPNKIYSPTLTIRKVPKGGRCVVSRMVLGNRIVFWEAIGLVVEDSAGDVVFEDVEARTLNSCRNVAGTVFIQNCKLTTSWVGPPNSWKQAALELDRVKLCLIQDSVLTNQAPGHGPQRSGLTATRSTVEISNSSLQGGYGAKGQLSTVYPAGAGLLLNNSTAYVRGRSTDRFTGGKPANPNGFPATGGDAIHLINSKLIWSGVSLFPGTGRTNGKAIANTRSIVTLMKPALPLLTRTAPFAAGSRTTFHIQGQPSSISVTWLTLHDRPLPTPLGYLIADLQTLLMPLATVHDTKGLGTQTLDLRRIHRRHIGDTFVLQALSMAPSTRLSLTNSQMSVIH